MNKFNHIKAFTILEIVFSLAIISILITMVYTLYNNLNFQVHNYGKNSDAISQYNLLNVVLKRDIHNAKTLDYSSGILALHTNKGLIEYKYKNETLIRIYNKKQDTLSCAVKTFQIQDSNVVFKPSFKKLNVTFQVLGQDIKGVYYKDFGVSNAVNKELFYHGN